MYDPKRKRANMLKSRWEKSRCRNMDVTMVHG